MPWWTRIEYHDSTIISGSDTVHLLCGTNQSLGIRFFEHLYDSIAPNLDLSTSSAEGYMWKAPDTSNWKLYHDEQTGVSFRYPPELSVGEGIDEETGVAFLSLGVESGASPDSGQERRFFPSIQLSISNKSFTEEAALHDWDTTRPGLWYTVQVEDCIATRGANGGMLNTCYIQGRHWQALHGHPYWPGGETLLFLAVAEDPDSDRSMTLEFLDDPPNVVLFESDICAILSSVVFDH